MEGNTMVTITGQHLYDGMLCVWTTSAGLRSNTHASINSSSLETIAECPTPRLDTGYVSLALTTDSQTHAACTSSHRFLAYPTIFLTDPVASSVLRFNALTGAFVDTFIEPYSGGLKSPQAAAFGLDSNLYISNDRGSNVLSYNGQNGQFIKIFCTVPGSPRGLMFHGQDLFVCSAYHNAVYRFNGLTGSPKVCPLYSRLSI